MRQRLLFCLLICLFLPATIFAADTWTVNSFDFTRQAIDWPASQHGTVPSGSFLDIDGTYFKVLNSWAGTSSGPDYIGAEIAPCDPTTGLQNGIDLRVDIFTGKPIILYETFGMIPTFCPVPLFGNPDPNLLLLSPGQNQFGKRVWAEFDFTNSMVRVMTLVGETPTLLDSWYSYQSGPWVSSPSVNNAGDVVWSREEEGTGALMIHGIINGEPIDPFPGYFPAINDNGEIVYVVNDALMSSMRGPLATFSTPNPSPDINNRGDVVWAEGNSFFDAFSGYMGTWTIYRLNNLEGATIETVASRSIFGASADIKLSSPTISDVGEVVWSDSGTLFSSLRGPIAFNCFTTMEGWEADFIGNDSLIFFGLDRSVRPAIQTINRLDFLPPGCTDDQDCDGMPDSWEYTYGFNESDSADAGFDSDSDGLKNLAEFQSGTKPNSPDTDGDGMPDGVDPQPTVANAAAPASLTVPTSPTNGRVNLVAPPPVLSGTTFLFEYTSDGAAWTTGYSGSSWNVTFALPAPGTYQFRVSVTATGYLPSEYRAGTNPCTWVLSPATAPASLTVPASPTNGKVNLIAPPPVVTGTTYLFEYSSDGATWLTGYSGSSWNVTFALPAPGTYQFRVSVTATNFTQSPYRDGSNPCNWILSPATAPASLSVPASPTNGKVNLIAPPPVVTGTTYLFEYSTDGSTWLTGYSGRYWNVTFALPAPGAYQFRVSVTATNFSQSAYRAGSNSTTWVLGAAPTPVSLSVPTGTTTGKVNLVASPPVVTGTTYLYEYSTDGTTWSTGYSGPYWNVTVTLPATGTYQYRVSVSAPNFTPSAYRPGSNVVVW